MNTFRTTSIIVALLGSGVAPAAIAQGAPTTGTAVQTTQGDDARRERATFLGVEVSDVPAALASHLKLPEGQGLVVNHVLPDSPASAAGFERHDILLRLDDQILVNQRQLSVLIRAFESGDRVVVTFLRAGAEARATVTLDERELPRGPRRWFDNLPQLPFLEGRGEELREKLRLHADEWSENVWRLRSEGTAVGPARMAFFRPQSGIVYADEEGTLQLRVNRDARTLIARDPDGVIVFEGPVGTEAERAALPENLRKRLERLEAAEWVEPPMPPTPPTPPEAPMVFPQPGSGPV